MIRKVAAAFLAFLLSASGAPASTYWQYPDTGGLIGTEVFPLSYPQGGGVYQTRKTTASTIAAFVEADLLGRSNTWLQGQICALQCSFTAAPAFASLTGYLYANGAGVGATAATTIPMSAITGPLPAAQVPVATSSTLGGVKTATAGSHQFMTGINGSGVPTFGQPAFADLTGSLALSAATGQILAGQIPNSIITLAMMANFQATSLMGNNSGSPSVPVPVSMTSALDMVASAQGDILYRNASVWTPLAPGTNGQVLTMAGTTAPSWVTPTILSGYQLLATLNPSGVTNIVATSLPVNSEYYITFNNVVTATVSATLNVQYSINNGGLYTSLGLTLGDGSNAPHYGFCDINGVLTDVIEFRGFVGSAATPTAATGVGTLNLFDGYALPAGQINAFKISASVGNMSSGVIKIWGR